MKYLKSKIIDQILIITINRPDKLNALNSRIIDELDSLLIEHRDNNDIKVLIISGSGK